MIIVNKNSSFSRSGPRGRSGSYRRYEHARTHAHPRTPTNAHARKWEHLQLHFQHRIYKRMSLIAFIWPSFSIFVNFVYSRVMLLIQVLMLSRVGCIHLSIHPSTKPPTHPSTYPSFYTSTHLFFYQSIHPSIHPSIHAPIHARTHIHPSIHPSAHCAFIT